MNKKDTKYKLCILLDPRDRKLLCQIALKTSKCLSSITVRTLSQNHNRPRTGMGLKTQVCIELLSSFAWCTHQIAAQKGLI